MDKEPQDSNVASEPVEAASAQEMSRRALVRGATPMILSLSSSAALARSSNLIGATTEEAAKDWAGNTLCLDRRSVLSVSSDGEVYDLGPNPLGTVYRIKERDYHYEKNNSPNTAISEGQMCRLSDATYYFNDGYGWQQVRLPQGILVSGRSLGSFSSTMTFIDI